MNRKWQMRKRSDEDLEKYNQIVVADEQEVEHDYKSDYRGKVQNRKADLAFLPMYGLTFTRPHDEVKTEIPFEAHGRCEAFALHEGYRL